MRDPNRIDVILEQLRAVWLLEPDLRLGQLVFNATRLADPSLEIFSIDDDLLASGLTQYSKTISASRGSVV